MPKSVSLMALRSPGVCAAFEGAAGVAKVPEGDAPGRGVSSFGAAAARCAVT